MRTGPVHFARPIMPAPPVPLLGSDMFASMLEKNLKQGRESAARLQGTEVSTWDQEKRVYVGTGIFCEKVRAVAVPVNLEA